MSDPHGPATAILDAPTSNGASPIGTIRLHPAGASATLPHPISRAFRRNFLDRQDPFEAAGRQMHEFTFSSSYHLPGDSPSEVAAEIRAELHARLSEGNLEDAELELVDFKDAALQHEPARQFIVTSTVTRRQTLATVNAYFRPCGHHLFYSVRSYVLPDLKLWKLVLAITGIALWVGTVAMLPVGKGAVFMFGLVLLLVHLRNFVRDVLAGDSLRLALRKQYPGRVDVGTFDDDDVTAFLKTNLALMLDTIADVLEKYGLDTRGLRTIIENLQVNQINTGGGNIIGAVFGGTGNSASGTGGK